jgi:hypothetical protein
MRKKRKFKNSLEAMRTIDSMPTQQTQSTYTGKTGLRAFQDAEKEAARLAEDQEAARVTKLTDEINANVRRVRDAESEPVAKWWKQEIATISALGLPNAPYDKWLVTETSEKRADDAAIFQTYKTFRSDIEARGISLTSDSWTRLGAYLSVQSFHGHAKLDSQNTWRDGLCRLYTLGVVEAQGDPLSLIKTEPQPQAEPQPQPQEPSFDEVLATTSGETRDGQQRLRAAELTARSHEVLSLYGAWLKSVEQGFGWYPTAEEVNAVVSYMQRHNLPPLAERSWDTARVACCRLGLINHDPLPLTGDEILTLDLDRSTAPLSDWNTKQEFLRRASQLARA